MRIDNTKITYRRVKIKDLEILIDYRLRFLNESEIQTEDIKIAEFQKALHTYFLRTILKNEYIYWLAVSGRSFKKIKSVLAFQYN